MQPRTLQQIGSVGISRFVHFALAIGLTLGSFTTDVSEPEPIAHAAEAAQTAMGNTRWAVILCKFSDEADEPQSQAFFQDFFSESGAGQGGMFDYWRDISYGAIDLTGSTVHGWYAMPYTRDEYVRLGETASGRQAKVQACVDAAATDPSFPSKAVAAGYYGIAAMLNAQQPGIDLFGGQVNLEVAGIKRQYGVIALHPDAWQVTHAAHEMGHGYGLPHSHAANPDREYGDGWDIMSGINFGSHKPTFQGSRFGVSGPALSAPYRERLGWLPQERVWNYDRTPSTVSLAALDMPGADGWLMARVPLDASRHYAVEFRRKHGWDQAIPRDTVLVREVRANGRSYLQSQDGEYELVAGTSFCDAANNIAISVLDVDPSTATASLRIGDLTDRTAPTTAHRIIDGPTGVMVTLAAKDDTSGCGPRQIEYEAVGAQSIAPTTMARATAYISITAPGETTIHYWATDRAGNVEGRRSLTVRMATPTRQASLHFGTAVDTES